ncbi:hypothetical protein EKK58_05100 [Candidatus Dependentiae bacterium]|nr:MAG: hypothetical protein EKK58_05100 [Candidatus Dependentiae bacterium]
MKKSLISLLFASLPIFAAEKNLNLIEQKDVDSKNIRSYKANTGFFASLDTPVIEKILLYSFEDLPWLQRKTVKLDDKLVDAWKITPTTPVETLMLFFNVNVLSHYFYIVTDSYKPTPYVCFDRTVFDYDCEYKPQLEGIVNQRETKRDNKCMFKYINEPKKRLAVITITGQNEYDITFFMDYKIIPKYVDEKAFDCLITRFRTVINFNQKGYIYHLLSTHLGFVESSYECEAVHGSGSFRKWFFTQIQELIDCMKEENDPKKHWELLSCCELILVKESHILLKYLFNFLFTTKNTGDDQNYVYHTVFSSFLFIKKRKISILVPKPLEQLSLNAILPKMQHLKNLKADSWIWLIVENKINSLSQTISLLQKNENLKQVLTIIKLCIYEIKILKIFFKRIITENKELSSKNAKGTGALKKLRKQLNHKKNLFKHTLIKIFFLAYIQKSLAIQEISNATLNTLNWLFKETIFKNKSFENSLSNKIFSMLKVMQVIIDDLDTIYKKNNANPIALINEGLIILDKDAKNDNIVDRENILPLYQIAIYIQSKIWRDIKKDVFEKEQYKNLKEIWMLSHIFSQYKNNGYEEFIFKLKQQFIIKIDDSFIFKLKQQCDIKIDNSKETEKTITARLNKNKFFVFIFLISLGLFTLGPFLKNIFFGQK